MRMLAAVLVGSFLLAGCAASGLEGTWVLDSRELPDGTMQVRPAIVGCMSFADGLRNFNVYWEDANGQPVSVSSVAEYALTGSTYTETNLFYRESGLGAGVSYDLERHGATSEVVDVDGFRVFEFPLHGEPRVSLHGDHMTATLEGAFVDHWTRLD